MTNIQEQIINKEVSKINNRLEAKKVVFTKFCNPEQLQIEVFRPGTLVFKVLINNPTEVLKEFKSDRFIEAISE